nr:glycosyltransferase [Streptomyces sp.]
MPSRTETAQPPRRVPPFARTVVLSLAAAYGLVLLATSAHYDYKGDELYFLVAGRHLSWGYADQPPLLPLLARLMEEAAPGNLMVLRSPVTVLMPLTAVVTALISREFGGGPRAQALACATFLISPHVLVISHSLTKRPIEVFLCAVMLWLLIRWVRIRDDRLWPAMGAVTALALQNNYLDASFWAVTAVTMTVQGIRNIWRRPQVWAAVAIVAVSLVPSLTWQARNGWPQIAMGAVIGDEVAAEGGRLLFLPLLLLSAGIVGSVLLCSGLWWLLRDPGLRSFRFLGWTVIVLAVLIFAANGKRDYLAALAFPVCWAAAAVQVERGTTAPWWRWLRSWPAMLLSLTVCLRAVLPLDITWLGGADRHFLPLEDPDWRGLSAYVAAVHHQLPPAERQDTVVIAGDYWRSSALERFRSEYGLPPVYGDMRGYWYFATPPAGTRTVLYVGTAPDALRRHCDRFQQRTPFKDATDGEGPMAENAVPVSVCSGLAVSLPELWPDLHHLDLRSVP